MHLALGVGGEVARDNGDRRRVEAEGEGHGALVWGPGDAGEILAAVEVILARLDGGEGARGIELARNKDIEDDVAMEAERRLRRADHALPSENVRARAIKSRMEGLAPRLRAETLLKPNHVDVAIRRQPRAQRPAYSIGRVGLSEIPRGRKEGGCVRLCTSRRGGTRLGHSLKCHRRSQTRRGPRCGGLQR